MVACVVECVFAAWELGIGTCLFFRWDTDLCRGSWTDTGITLVWTIGGGTGGPLWGTRGAPRIFSRGAQNFFPCIVASRVRKINFM